MIEVLVGTVRSTAFVEAVVSPVGRDEALIMPDYAKFDTKDTLALWFLRHTMCLHEQQRQTVTLHVCATCGSLLGVLAYRIGMLHKRLVRECHSKSSTAEDSVWKSVSCCLQGKYNTHQGQHPASMSYGRTRSSCCHPIAVATG